jgi:putative membrane protein
MMVLAVGAFTAVNQAFVAVSGERRGWLVSIAFAALQVVSLGGLVPINTAPAPFQTLNQVLPVARAADGFAQLTLGGEVGSLTGDVLVLLLWGLAALAVTAVAARRAQKVEPVQLQEETARRESMAGAH